MRMTRALPIGLMALTSLVCACRKSPTMEAIEASAAALVQRGPAGASTWIVAPDGVVNATLKTPDGQPVTQAVTGQMTFAPPDGPPTSVPVSYDPKTGVLNAAGPKLDADITPVRYALDVGGAPWNGSIDVPKGGTLDLAENAKLQPPPSPDAVGPNGGVVEVVGPDRVELVADKPTGDLRAYVLDADNKPVDPGDRTITVALQGEQPQLLVLAPEPQGHFVVGHLRSRVDPVHVTVAVNAHGRTHACLVGWSPGAVVVVGPQAPRVRLLAVESPGEVEVPGRHWRHHAELVVGAPGVVVGAPEVTTGAPGVVVGGPGVVLGGPGVVVGGPGVVVGGPGVAIGGPRAFVGPPGLVVGPPGVVHGPGGGNGWGPGHEHGGGHKAH